jgi:catechol 2,3-dioxygenase-like lactoylglutathione lyase family enzyme
MTTTWPPQPDGPGRSAGGTGLAHGVLHCNINTGDVSAAHDFYAGLLGLNRRMRSQSSDADGTALGIEGTTDTDAWFLYDWRGPRVAAALELVQWNDPALADRPPPEPWRTGLSALGYYVPDVSVVERRLREPAPPGSAHPGTVRSGALPHRGASTHGLRVTDLDGVTVELVEAPHPYDPAPGATLSHLRINCSDLGDSLAWYTALGFTPLVARSRVTLPGDVAGVEGEIEVSIASLALPRDRSFTLELVQWHRPTGTGTPPQAANSQGLYRIALASEHVTARQGAEPVWIPMAGTPLGGLTVLFLKDPDGVVVELVERPASALARRD